MSGLRKYLPLAVALSLGLAAPPASAALLTMKLHETGFVDATFTDVGQSTPGQVIFVGSFGTFFVNFDLGASTPVQPAPDLWLNGLATSSTTTGGATIAGTLTITLTVSGLTSPLSPAMTLTSGMSGTNSTGMSQSADSYFDAGDGLPATGGIHLAHAASSLPSWSTSPTSVVDTGAGPYSESWVWSAITDGLFHDGSGNTAGTQLRLEAVRAPVPEPASLAIFGTALLGFGLLRRRRNS